MKFINLRVRALQKLRKIVKKSMKNRSQFGVGKKRPGNCFKSGFGTVLGSIWEGVGTLWAAFWPILGAFWRFFGRSRSYLVKALVQDGLQEAFWMDLGSLWEGFGTVWEGFG